MSKMKERWAELEQAAKNATPGPWAQEEIDPTDPEWGACEVFTEESGDIVSSHVCSKENAAYIAAANPATILELLEVTKGLAEALSLLLIETEDDPRVLYITKRNARAALAKYEGVQSE